MLNFRSLFINVQEKDARQRKVYAGYNIEDIDLVYNIETDCYLKVTCKSGKTFNLDINPEEINWDMDGIIIPGYIGTYSVVDCIIRNEKIYYLLEHEEYGDETAYLIVDNYNNVIDDEVYDEWLVHLEEALC